MQRQFSAETEATPDDLFAVVRDLTTYPRWLSLVDTVEPADGSGAWLVTLRTRIGPVARSKRLRMVDVPQARPRRARFERQEVDGKDHSAWVFDVAVEPHHQPPLASRVVLVLGYGGRLWTGLLDGVLESVAAEATDRLRAYVRP